MMVWISVESVVISPLSFFIASIWLFSLFFLLIWLVVYFVDLFEKPAPGFIDFLKGFSCLYLLQFCSDLSYFLSSADFEFVCFCISSSFNCDVRVLMLDHSCFLCWVFSSINFHLHTALNVSQRFWYVVYSFSLVLKNTLFSPFILLFIQQSFRSRLFSFHVAGQFWVSFLILSCYLSALWSERLFVMISVLLDLLRSVFQLCGQF